MLGKPWQCPAGQLRLPGYSLELPERAQVLQGWTFDACRMHQSVLLKSVLRGRLEGGLLAAELLLL